MKIIYTCAVCGMPVDTQSPNCVMRSVNGSIDHVHGICAADPHGTPQETATKPGTHEAFFRAQVSKPIASTHETIAREIGALVDKKHAAYGPAIETSAKALALLYPDGMKPDQYVKALVLARMWDKFSRIATDEGALGEDPWSDLAGYALRMVAMGRAAKA